MKRLALVGASLVLVGAMTAACGDDDKDSNGGDKGGASSTPTDAATDDFCAAMEAFDEVGTDQKKFDSALEELTDTGTPKEIVGDSREGFVLFVDALLDVDSSNLADVKDPTFSEDEKTKATAFITQYATLCTPDPTEAPAE